jgi:hypothetical protein
VAGFFIFQLEERYMASFQQFEKIEKRTKTVDKRKAPEKRKKTIADDRKSTKVKETQNYINRIKEVAVVKDMISVFVFSSVAATGPHGGI